MVEPAPRPARPGESRTRQKCRLGPSQTRKPAPDAQTCDIGVPLWPQGTGPALPICRLSGSDWAQPSAITTVTGLSRTVMTGAARWTRPAGSRPPARSAVHAFQDTVLADCDRCPVAPVVVSEPDLLVVDACLQDDSVAAGDHGGGQAVTTVGPAQAGAGVPGLAAVPGDVHVAAAAGRQDRSCRSEGYRAEVTGEREGRHPVPRPAAVIGQVQAFDLVTDAGLAAAAQRQDAAGRGE